MNFQDNEIEIHQASLSLSCEHRDYMVRGQRLFQERVYFKSGSPRWPRSWMERLEYNLKLRPKDTIVYRFLWTGEAGYIKKLANRYKGDSDSVFPDDGGPVVYTLSFRDLQAALGFARSEDFDELITIGAPLRC